MKIIFKSLLLVSILSCQSCATIVRDGIYSPAMNNKITPLYPATSIDVVCMGNALTGTENFMYLFGGLIDLPFSLVFDTILLPHDIYDESKSEYMYLPDQVEKTGNTNE